MENYIVAIICWIILFVLIYIYFDFSKTKNYMKKICTYFKIWLIDNKIKLITILLLATALYIAFQEYSYNERFLWVVDTKKSITLKPAMISTLI